MLFKKMNKMKHTFIGTIILSQTQTKRTKTDRQTDRMKHGNISKSPKFSNAR